MKKDKLSVLSGRHFLVCDVIWKLLAQVHDLPFTIETIPDVFTTFRTKTEMKGKVRVAFEKPLHIKSPKIADLKLPTLEELGLKYLSIDSNAVIQFKGGESEAFKRLNYYFFDTQKLSVYKETRNGMIGSDYSSKLSPWLAMGCISPRSVYKEIKKYELLFGANESTYWMVFELLWRDYFRFQFKKHDAKFFQYSGIKKDAKKPSNTNKRLFFLWANGTTSSDFINANMIELKKTGFMSNRGRQNVASYFCNELNQDWRMGASYFESQLIDYDVCTNWGNWAYLAGVGNDPRKYRFFNIEKQADTYDNDWSYRKLWLEK